MDGLIYRPEFVLSSLSNLDRGSSGDCLDFAKRRPDSAPSASVPSPVPAARGCQKLSLPASSRRWKTRAFLFRQSSISSLWPWTWPNFLSLPTFRPPTSQPPTHLPPACSLAGLRAGWLAGLFISPKFHFQPVALHLADFSSLPTSNPGPTSLACECRAQAQ